MAAAWREEEDNEGFDDVEFDLSKIAKPAGSGSVPMATAKPMSSFIERESDAEWDDFGAPSNAVAGATKTGDFASVLKQKMQQNKQQLPPADDDPFADFDDDFGP